MGKTFRPGLNNKESQKMNIEKNNSLPSPLKWHGGKHYLAKKIIGLMPPHLHYVEPFAGSLAVLLERDPNRNWLRPGKGGSSAIVRNGL
jgi:hypothetical protein